MASIVVRGLSASTKERLRQRAVRHKCSLEAEVRAVVGPDAGASGTLPARRTARPTGREALIIDNMF